MLHAPMSNQQGMALGAGGLHGGMTKEEFLRVLRGNIAAVPYVQGVNNHTGSQLTQEAAPMAWLMAELQHQGLYFVDSRTTANTLAERSAQAIGLPSGRRDVFLDNSQAPNHIAAQLAQAIALAKRHGSAIAIGHPYPNTLAQLAQLPSLLAQQQVELVPASHLMRIKHPAPLAKPKVAARLYCQAPPQGLWYSPWAPQSPFAPPMQRLPHWQPLPL